MLELKIRKQSAASRGHHNWKECATQSKLKVNNELLMRWKRMIGLKKERSCKFGSVIKRQQRRHNRRGDEWDRLC